MRYAIDAMLRTLAFSSVLAFKVLAGETCLESYSIFSREASDLRDRSRVLNGNIGSNTYVELGVESRLFGNLKSIKNATLRDRAVIQGDAETGGILTRNNQTQITGTVIQNPDLEPCIIPENPNFTTGSADITVGNDQTMNLPPGNYRDLMVYSRSKLFLRKGIYNFRKFQIEPDVQVNVQDNTGTEINVLESLALSDRTSIAFSAASNPLALKIYTHQQTPLRIGVESKFIGILTAPRAEVNVASRAPFVGRLFGKRITVEPDVMACTPPKALGIYHSEGAYGPFFDPNQMEYNATVSNTVTQLDIGADLEKPGDVLTINGTANATVPIPGDSLRVDLKITRPVISGFPAACFESHYILTIKKSPNAIVRVKDGSACAGSACDGTTWEKAYKDLQSGLDASQRDGREIWLARGSYKPSARRDPADARSSTFLLGSGAELHGGFEGLTDEMLDTRRGIISACVLSGDIAGNDDLAFPGDLQKMSENSYHTLTFKGSGSGIYLDRVTVTRGSATGAKLTNQKGGGIFIGGSSPVLRELVLIKNYANQKGGALYAEGSKNLQVFNTYIVENRAVAEGGGLALVGAGGNLGNLVFGKNQGASGGAISLRNSSPFIRHSTFAANSATFGAGILAVGTSQPTIDQTILWGNSAQSGAGIHKDMAASPTIGYSDIQGAFINGKWNDDLGQNGGANLDMDPVYTDAPSGALGADGIAFTQDDGFQLDKTSPVIDKGRASVPADFSFDLFGVTRPGDGDKDGVEIADMGAYEFFAIGSGDVSVGYYIAKTRNFYPVVDYQVAEIQSSTPDIVDLAANSSAGYTIKLLAAKNKHLKDAFYGYVKTLKDDAIFSQGVKVTFFRLGEEDGKLVYANRRSDGASFVNGKPIVFVSNKALETGFNQKAYLIHAPVNQGAMKVLVDVPHSQF